MKLNITGSLSYVIIDGELKSKHSDSFVVEKVGDTLNVSNGNRVNGSNLNISGDGDITIINSFNNNCSNTKIVINGVDVSSIVNSKEEKEEELNKITKYKLEEVISIISLSGSSELEVIEMECLSSNLNISLSGSSYLKLGNKEFLNILSNISGSSKLSLFEDKIMNMNASLSGSSTLKLVLSNITNLNLNASGASKCLKDKTDIFSFNKFLSGVASVKEI